MKTKVYLILLFLFAATSMMAQELRVLDSDQYTQLKKTNQLPEKFMMKKIEK